MNYIVGNYMMVLPEQLNVKYELYEDEHFKGVKFISNVGIVNVSYNKQVDWARILINNFDGSNGDVPFSERTFHFLPKEVMVEKVK